MFNTLSPFEYRQLENGVHEFVLRDSSREAVDTWFQQLKKLHMGSKEQAVLRHLVVAANDTLPIGYIFQCARRLAAQKRDCAPNRMAFLHKDGFYLSFAEAFVRAWHLNHHDVIRFFPMSQREAAIEWLLNEG